MYVPRETLVKPYEKLLSKPHTQKSFAIRGVCVFGCGFVATTRVNVSYETLLCSERDVCEMALRGKIAVSTQGQFIHCC